MQIAKK